MKRIIGMFLAFFLSFVCPAAGAQASVSVFEDVQESFWARPAIERWAQRGILTGSGGMYRPNAYVTMAEFSAVLNRIISYPSVTENPFTNLNDSEWYYGDILCLAAAGVIPVQDMPENPFGDLSGSEWNYAAIQRLEAVGVITGDGGKVYPNDFITREEAAVILCRAFRIELSNGIPDPLPLDAEDISPWAIREAHTIWDLEYFFFGTGRFHPQRLLLRSELATILDNILTELYTKPGEYGDNSAEPFLIDGNVMINTPGVTLRNMVISGDLYLSDGIGGGEIVLENVDVKGGIYIYGEGSLLELNTITTQTKQ